MLRDGRYHGRMTNAHRHRTELLMGLTRSQAERLAHIDFRLYFLGELRRLDVSDRFGTGPAGATRDIAMYREIAPDNLVLDPSDKVYRPSDVFVPVFAHAPARALTALSQGFGDGVGGGPGGPLVRCEFPMSLNVPSMAIVAPVTRAIHRGRAIRLRYRSASSGAGQREIVPIALVDTGVRWHVRGFDRKSGDFRDFVFTRMSDVVVLPDRIAPEESAEHDVQWNRIVELELVPHPGYADPALVRMDHDMPDGVLRVSVRAANVGYMLRRWNVDCSPDHSLEGPEYPLWLRDPLVLYGASNAILAPGYCDPRATDRTPTGRSPRRG